MNSNTPYREERPWGEFIEFTRNAPSTVKIISVKPNELLSLQTHKKRDEFWYFLSGTGTITIGDKTIEVSPGFSCTIVHDTPHRISATTELKVLEISTGEFDEQDIVRLEDKYNRS